MVWKGDEMEQTGGYMAKGAGRKNPRGLNQPIAPGGGAWGPSGNNGPMLRSALTL